VFEELFRAISTNSKEDVIRFAVVFTVKCMQGRQGYLDILRGVNDRGSSNANINNANNIDATEDPLRTRRWKIHACLNTLTNFIQPPEVRQDAQSLLQRVVGTHGEAMLQWRRAGGTVAPRMLSVIGFEDTAAAVRSCVMQRDAERHDGEERF